MTTISFTSFCYKLAEPITQFIKILRSQHIWRTLLCRILPIFRYSPFLKILSRVYRVFKHIKFFTGDIKRYVSVGFCNASHSGFALLHALHHWTPYSSHPLWYNRGTRFRSFFSIDSIQQGHHSGVPKQYKFYCEYISKSLAAVV